MMNYKNKIFKLSVLMLMLAFSSSVYASEVTGTLSSGSQQPTNGGSTGTLSGNVVSPSSGGGGGGGGGVVNPNTFSQTNNTTPTSGGTVSSGGSSSGGGGAVLGSSTSPSTQPRPTVSSTSGNNVALSPEDSAVYNEVAVEDSATIPDTAYDNASAYQTAATIESGISRATWLWILFLALLLIGAAIYGISRPSKSKRTLRTN